LSRNGTVQRTFFAFEIRPEVVDTFVGQSVEADSVDHRIDRPAGNPGRRKIALGIAERHPRPLSSDKELRCFLIVPQAVLDLRVNSVKLGVRRFVDVAVAVV
jgi:hypothetical protein